MVEIAEHLNPAQIASEQALAEVYDCLERNQSFLVEAGAGAGKTYTLVKALHFLIDRNKHVLPKRHQKIACITFTNVAKDEIDVRTDRSPLVHSDTIHGFCWSLICGFQSQLRTHLSQLQHWRERIAEAGGLGERSVKYDLGHPGINEHRISIHHNDVLAMTVSLMENAKFRRILRDKYPIILIDEYQDTNANWVHSIETQFLGQDHAPLFGFFGDHWQKIYGDGCGRIEHPSLTVIGKQANFRSVSTVVDCLNRMRPELPQFVVDPEERGTVRVFHTNSWTEPRQAGAHWRGDLPSEATDRALNSVLNCLTEDGWDLSPESTKILMLTHRVLAGKQGYPSIPRLFRYNDSFTRKEDPHVSFFADALEPACEAYLAKEYGAMFLALGSRVPPIRAHADKGRWAESMDQLTELRREGTVGDVMDHLLSTRRPDVPETIERREHALRQLDPDSDEEVPRTLTELKDLRAVPYAEIISLCRYLRGHSPFETKHGVKGAEFENVLVVVGRGWSRYNFNHMLEMASDTTGIPTGRRPTFERNRNLFYVTCSRPKRRLAVLFTQELSPLAMQTVTNWFGDDTLVAVNP